MTRFRLSLRRVTRDDRGNASIEFVFMFPLIFGLFLASFEAGYMALRSTMLERALDQTVRDLRLGNLRSASVDALRESLCNRTDMFPDCRNSVTLELTRINAGFSNLPGVSEPCARRNPQIVAGTDGDIVDTGVENEMMVVRACMVTDALFPTAFMGVNSALADADGTYALVATAAFVNEPN
jgi:Flp pilus assembly protein TadG